MLNFNITDIDVRDQEIGYVLILHATLVLVNVYTRAFLTKVSGVSIREGPVSSMQVMGMNIGASLANFCIDRL